MQSFALRASLYSLSRSLLILCLKVLLTAQLSSDYGGKGEAYWACYFSREITNPKVEKGASKYP